VDTQLYKSLCPSIHPSVGPSVRQSVGVHETKSAKTRISAPAHPSATGMVVYPGLLKVWTTITTTTTKTPVRLEFVVRVGMVFRRGQIFNCNLNVRYQQSKLQNKRKVWLSSLKTVLILCLCQCHMLFLSSMARYGVIAHRKWKEIWNQHTSGILQAVDVNSRRRSLAAVTIFVKLCHISSFLRIQKIKKRLSGDYLCKNW